tara:strand:+ start:2139 stop:3023 length:885 start_codon:yes stop_codon:yes gene_type:complete
MAVTAEMVKTLRQRTGAGMMECKKALVEAGTDIEKAAQLLREKGAASAEKKAGRIATDGTVALQISSDGSNGAIVEINCETDFVARDNSFGKFAEDVVQNIIEKKPNDLSQLLESKLNSNEAIEDARKALITRIGENISVRRFEVLSSKNGSVYGYLHGRKIGVIVSITGGNEMLGKDIAMHIAASNPMSIDESEISKKALENEKKIYTAQAQDAGKSKNILEKIVEGKLKKYLKENTLLGQEFVKDPQITVGALLDSSNAKVEKFARYELGEGLEKRNDDFVGEVLAQATGNN